MHELSFLPVLFMPPSPVLLLPFLPCSIPDARSCERLASSSLPNTLAPGHGRCPVPPLLALLPRLISLFTLSFSLVCHFIPFSLSFFSQESRRRATLCLLHRNSFPAAFHYTHATACLVGHCPQKAFFVSSALLFFFLSFFCPFAFIEEKRGNTLHTRTLPVVCPQASERASVSPTGQTATASRQTSPKGSIPFQPLAMSQSTAEPKVGPCE